MIEKVQSKDAVISHIWEAIHSKTIGKWKLKSDIDLDLKPQYQVVGEPTPGIPAYKVQTLDGRNQGFSIEIYFYLYKESLYRRVDLRKRTLH